MSLPTTRRIVIAGQVPPPMGGQNVMIASLLEELRTSPSLRVEHLAFHFTRDFTKARSAQFGKLVEVFRVIARLLRLRLRGPIDLLVFPPGGPQNVPLLRDLLLLPWILLLSRKTLLHFHAAGIGERLLSPGLLVRVVRWLYGRCDGAIVMTEYNRRDPEACGIHNVHVIPHRLEDEFDPTLVDRAGDEIRILYMGHLCPDKGTPALLEAFAAVAGKNGSVRLELAGEPLSPYSLLQLEAAIRRCKIEDRVRLLGVVRDEAKKKAFGRAHLFVFPSVAPYESFGLVMVEAMMWGLPVVASDWRGNRDVMGEAGWLYPVNVNTVAALVDTLERAVAAIQSGDDWRDRARGRFTTQFCRNEASARQFHQFFQEVSA